MEKKSILFRLGREHLHLHLLQQCIVTINNTIEERDIVAINNAIKEQVIVAINNAIEERETIYYPTKLF